MFNIFKSKKRLNVRIKEECWSMDYYLVKWLNEHLKVYLEDASRCVDLTYYTFVYQKKEYTQAEIIKILIGITDEMLNNYYTLCDDKKLIRLKNKMYDLLKLIHFALWW